MFKNALKTIYKRVPFPFKFILVDIYLYLKSKSQNGVSISSIVFDSDFDKVAVVGNGPSLKKDKQNFRAMINSHDFICVNNFCDDELYEVIKPKLYVFLDSYFFSETAHPDWVERREKTFSIINKKTDWPMQIILPHGADEKILKQCITNKNVTIIKITTQSLFCEKYTGFIGKMFDSGFYGPPQNNVLIYAIYLAIWAKYKYVYVYGADLSFHKDVNVDQETNDLYITFKHFNEEDTVELLRKNPNKIEKWRMAELLKLSADTFFAHEVMFDYSQHKGISIYNKSSQSLIDAYPRRYEIDKAES